MKGLLAAALTVALAGAGLTAAPAEAAGRRVTAARPPMGGSVIAARPPMGWSVIAARPPMGWSSWSSLRGSISEAAIEAQADVMHAKLQRYGYRYVNIDAG